MSTPRKIRRTDVESSEQVFNATVHLDNFESYQLRVVPDSVGNVYVWVDMRVAGNKWEKVFTLLNGEPRSV